MRSLSFSKLFLRQTFIWQSRSKPLSSRGFRCFVPLSCSSAATSSKKDVTPPNIQELFQAAPKKLPSLEIGKKDVKLELYALFQQSEAMSRYTPLVERLAANREAHTSSTVRPRGSGPARLEAKDNSSNRGSSNADNSNNKNISIEKERNIVYIRLNRPHAKNAFTVEMYDEIALTLDSAAEDKQVSLVVLTGTGEDFSYGNDMANFTTLKPDVLEKQIKAIRSTVKTFVQSMVDFPKPLIALVNGPARGIAVTILGLCDAVYCNDRATFSTPFTIICQCPVGCSSVTFPLMMGALKAAEVLIFNKELTAYDALDRNLVTRVFPQETFQQETLAIISDFSKLSAQWLKLLLGSQHVRSKWFKNSWLDTNCNNTKKD